jgi:hypothetical protein
MINAKFELSSFQKEMKSLIDYTSGFLEGANAGKRELLEKIGKKTVEMLEEFIDANARTNDAVLHHVYEWYQSGSPNARLFDIDYRVSGGGLTFSSTFRQSSSVSSGSSVPFYDKARIMEQGIPVRIKPVRSEVLAFEDNGEQVFTRSPITVRNPGGEKVAGGFKATTEMFFNSYWKQSFLQVTGIDKILSNTTQFKQNLPRAKAGGRIVGYDVGYRWISAKGVA